MTDTNNFYVGPKPTSNFDADPDPTLLFNGVSAEGGSGSVKQGSVFSIMKGGSGSRTLIISGIPGEPQVVEVVGVVGRPLPGRLQWPPNHASSGRPGSTTSGKCRIHCHRFYASF